MSTDISSFILHPSPCLFLAAFILDLALGDPRWLPHPAVLIGRLIELLEGVFRRVFRGKISELIAGGILAFIVPVTGSAVAFFIIYVVMMFSHWAGWLLAVFLGYTTIAAKSLYEEPLKVADLIAAGNLDEARKKLSYLVGRDTHNLDEKEIIRALVETVAENTSDGVIAPLFYLAVGGPPLAMAYKAINTLDSMVGYKNERYLYFGRASARLDDVFNYIPARFTALLMIIAAFILRKNWIGSWKTILRDGRNHSSPNSGYPEAAVAGAIGRRLGGPSCYGGVLNNKPFIGDEAGEFNVEDVKNSGRIMFISSVVMVGITVLILTKY